MSSIVSGVGVRFSCSGPTPGMQAEEVKKEKSLKELLKEIEKPLTVSLENVQKSWTTEEVGEEGETRRVVDIENYEVLIEIDPSLGEIEMWGEQPMLKREGKLVPLQVKVSGPGKLSKLKKAFIEKEGEAADVAQTNAFRLVINLEQVENALDNLEPIKPLEIEVASEGFVFGSVEHPISIITLIESNVEVLKEGAPKEKPIFRIHGSHFPKGEKGEYKASPEEGSKIEIEEIKWLGEGLLELSLESAGKENKDGWEIKLEGPNNIHILNDVIKIYPKSKAEIAAIRKKNGITAVEESLIKLKESNPVGYKLLIDGIKALKKKETPSKIKKSEPKKGKVQGKGPKKIKFAEDNPYGK